METPEIIAKNTGGTGFQPVDAGTYQARCFYMVLMGTIPGEYLGVPNLSEKVRIGWELPTERRVFKEGEPEAPFTVYKEYTLSLADKANLRKDLKAWRGKDFTDEEANAFNICKLVGVNCTLGIGHKTKGDKTYAEVTSVGPPMKGMIEVKQHNPNFILTYQNWNWDAFNTLPEYIRKKMETSKEFKAISNITNEEHTLAQQSSDNENLPF